MTEELSDSARKKLDSLTDQEWEELCMDAETEEDIVEYLEDTR